LIGKELGSLPVLPVEGMATKKPQILAYINEDVNAALDQLAKDRRWSRSNTAAYLIEKALIDSGYLPTEETNPPNQE